MVSSKKYPHLCKKLHIAHCECYQKYVDNSDKWNRARNVRATEEIHLYTFHRQLKPEMVVCVCTLCR